MGVDKYGILFWVWSDKGFENVGIVDNMLVRWGFRGMIIGKSIYN